MSIIPKNISLSIQRSVKVKKYMYNKVELGMVVEIQNEQPKATINKLYIYLNAEVDRLLGIELNKAGCNRQIIADKMEEDDEPPFCFETE